MGIVFCLFLFLFYLICCMVYEKWDIYLFVFIVFFIFFSLLDK